MISCLAGFLIPTLLSRKGEAGRLNTARGQNWPEISQLGGEAGGGGAREGATVPLCASPEVGISGAADFLLILGSLMLTHCHPMKIDEPNASGSVKRFFSLPTPKIMPQLGLQCSELYLFGFVFSEERKNKDTASTLNCSRTSGNRQSAS